MPLYLDQDRFLAQELDEALEPFKDVLPPDALDELQQALGEVYTHHPIVADLVNQLRPNPEGLKESDEVQTGSLQHGVVRPLVRDETKKNPRR